MDSLNKKWMPAEAKIYIGGVMRHVKAPSKLQLRGGLNHLCLPQVDKFMAGANTVKDINYIVDVGANIGATALMFNAAFPKARILAIEPVSMNWDCLVHNTKDIPEIARLKMAAGKSAGKIGISMPSPEQRPDMAIRNGNSGLYSIYGEDKDTTEYVDMKELDDIVDAPVDMLKIDVEGAEGDVLAGAKRIMIEDRPILVIELREFNIIMGGHTDDDYLNYFELIKYRQAGSYVGDIIYVPDELDTREWEAHADSDGRLR